MELSSRPDFTFSKSISETSPIAVDDDLDDDGEDLRVPAVRKVLAAFSIAKVGTGEVPVPDTDSDRLDSDGHTLPLGD